LNELWAIIDQRQRSTFVQNNSSARSLAFKNNEPYNAFRSVKTDCAHSTNPSQGGISRRHVLLASVTTLAVTYISYDSFILRNVIAIPSCVAGARPGKGR
jgi:hypothetical protein